MPVEVSSFLRQIFLGVGRGLDGPSVSMASASEGKTTILAKRVRISHLLDYDFRVIATPSGNASIAIGLGALARSCRQLP
jgi:hypothetical protein